MESGRRDKGQVERATALVIDRARCYVTKGKYRVLRAFLTEYSDAQLLVTVFGGNCYVHGSGYSWVMGGVEDVQRLAEVIKPYLQEGHRLEILSQPLPPPDTQT